MEDIMTIDEIIHAFTHVEELQFPIEALDDAVEKQEEITPVLLEYIQKSPADLYQDYKETKADNLANFMWDFSMLLLAQFREKAAFPHIIEFYTSTDQEMVDAVSAEFTTEKLPSVLASTFNGDTNALFDSAKNDSIDEFVRGSFIQASVILIAHDILNLDDIRPRYIKLFEQWIAEENMTLLTPLCDSIAGLADPQLRPYIDEVFQKNLVDDIWFDIDDIDDCYNTPLTKDDAICRMITNTFTETCNWIWFTGEDDFPFDLDLFDSDDIEDDDDSILDLLDGYTPPPPTISPETFIRDTPKVGRNDPCPCGSGKKYKKCCLND